MKLLRILSMKNQTEVIDLICDCGEVDTVEAIIGDTRIVNVLKTHRCPCEDPESHEYAIQYAHACGYKD